MMVDDRDVSRRDRKKCACTGRPMRPAPVATAARAARPG